MTIKKKQSILILINVRWWNATAFYAVNIARILHENGHRVFVGCDPSYPAFKRAGTCGLKVVPLSFYGANPVKLLTGLTRMCRLIRTEKIDIVNPHRSEDHFFALLAKKITGCLLVVTRGDQRPIKKSWFSRIKYGAADAVIATCRSIVDQNMAIFVSMLSRVHVVYGSVDETRFQRPLRPSSPANAFDFPPDSLIIGMVGRISRIKGQEILIRAAALALKQHRKLCFVIAGKEVEISRQALRQQAVALGIEAHFRFMGQVPRVADLIDACHICVSASLGSETISRVVLEYLYCGKAVIATAVNAIGEIVQPGVNGELVPPEDAEALARAILKLAQDSNLRRQYGRNSRRIYADNYSEEVFYRQYRNILKEL